MTIAEELSRLNSLFIDTAPIIYYIEAHPQFGPLTKEVFDAFLTNDKKLKKIKEIKVLVLTDFTTTA
ncbi:MAG: hypothetical protein M0R70_07230 [Nitrospirae bacterium]|nr:hypothetical protein [Nitrospirota bacterium]